MPTKRPKDPPGMTELKDDLTPVMGGDMDTDGHAITNTNANGDVILDPDGTGAVSTPLANYEDNVIDDNDFPNKKFVVDAILTAGKGIVFSDDFERADIPPWTKTDVLGVGTVEMDLSQGTTDIHVKSGGAINNETRARSNNPVVPEDTINDYLRGIFQNFKAILDTDIVYINLYADSTHWVYMKFTSNTTVDLLWKNGGATFSELGKAIVDCTARHDYYTIIRYNVDHWEILFYQDVLLIHTVTTTAEIPKDSSLMQEFDAYSDSGNDPQLWCDYAAMSILEP